MIHEEWIKLTPIKKIIVIAKLCGWTNCDEDAYDPWNDPIAAGSPSNGNGNARIPIPDFLNDLNSIHKIILEMPKYLRHRYVNNLSIICGDQMLEDFDREWCLLTATAAQLAEAFCKTKMENI